jgi:hypothetical protein
MVQFNELRITPDGKYLIIDASIKNEEYYNNVIIDSIIIDSQDTFIPSGPSNNPLYTYKVSKQYNNNVYSISEDCNCNPVMTEDKSYCLIKNDKSVNDKSVRLILNTQDIGVSIQDNMLFVYAVTSGTPAPNTPCGMDNYYTLGTVVYLYSLYRQSIYYLKELDSCNIPANLIDIILRIKAIELSIKTGNYTKAIQYWNKYIKGLSNHNISNCKCNERIN